MKTSDAVLTVRGVVASPPALEHFGSNGKRADLTLLTKRVEKDRQSGEWVVHTDPVYIRAEYEDAERLVQSVKPGMEVIVTAYMLIERWRDGDQEKRTTRFYYASHHRVVFEPSRAQQPAPGSQSRERVAERTGGSNLGRRETAPPAFGHRTPAQEPRSSRPPRGMEDLGLDPQY